jgi:transcriptional regulator with XRE-family HTH domain
MINKYSRLPDQLSDRMLTKDGRVLGDNGVTLMRSEINGKNFYMVESRDSRKIFSDERKAIVEFNDLDRERNKRSGEPPLASCGFGGDEHQRKEEQPAPFGFGKKKKKKKKKKKDDDGQKMPFSTIDSDTVDRTNLEQAMERKDLTVTKTAELAGVHPSAISRLLRVPRATTGSKDPGGRNPGIEMAAKLATEILGEPIENVFPDLFKAKRRRKKRKGNRKSGQSRRYAKKLNESIDLLLNDVGNKDELIAEGFSRIITSRPDLHDFYMAALSQLSSKSSISECRNTVLNYISKHSSLIKPFKGSSLQERFSQRLLPTVMESLVTFYKTIDKSNCGPKNVIKSALRIGYRAMVEDMQNDTYGKDQNQELDPEQEQDPNNPINKQDNMSPADMAKNDLEGTEDPAKMAENLKKMEDNKQNDLNKAKIEQDKHYADLRSTVDKMQAGYKEADDFYKNRSDEFDDQLNNIKNGLLNLQGESSQSSGSGPRI